MKNLSRHVGYNKTEAGRARTARYRQTDKYRKADRLKHRRRYYKKKIRDKVEQDIANKMPTSDLMKKYELSYQEVVTFKNRMENE